MKFILLFLVGFSVIHSLKIIPLRSKIEYSNPKYVTSVKGSVRRYGRGSLYYINFSGVFTATLGNNITCLIQMFEVISGNYVPVPFRIQFKLCDFLKSEPLIGKRVLPQLPRNMSSCPFSPGFYPIANLTFDAVDLPFDLPFTFQAIETLVCLDLQYSFTKSGGEKDLALHVTIHMRAIQKPRNKKLGVTERAKQKPRN